MQIVSIVNVSHALADYRLLLLGIAFKLSNLNVVRSKSIESLDSILRRIHQVSLSS